MVATHTLRPRTARDVRRLGRVDGCPECARNYETPTSTEDAPGGFVAHYHCTDCGHDWVTSWTDEEDAD